MDPGGNCPRGRSGGLLRPDSEPSAVFDEVAQTVKDIEDLGEVKAHQAKVAIIFDYESGWAWETQPQGENYDNFAICFEFYRGLRRNGLTVDVLPPSIDSLEGYQVVFAPSLLCWPGALMDAIQGFDGIAVLGPRAGSKTQNLTFPDSMPPAIPNFDCKVSYVETFPAGSERPLVKGGAVRTWLETVVTSENIIEQTEEGTPLMLAKGQLRYLTGWPDSMAMTRIVSQLAEEADLDWKAMPEGVRRRVTASHEFVFNHNSQTVEIDNTSLAPAEVRITSLS